MKSRQYPGYRDSRVTWLGEVPTHWAVKRLKFVATYQTSNVDKKSDGDEIPVRLCNYTDVYYRERIRPDQDFMEATATPAEVARFRLRVGDVLITKDSEDWRDIAVPALVEETADDLVCGYHLGIVRPASAAFGPYLFRVLQSGAVNQQFQIASTGVTRFGLANSAAACAILPLPPLDEQRAIAAFLDRETSRIDTLVEKKRLLIERLEEQRTALISRTVTRGLPPEAARAAGLDPSPRLKASGVEWLGDIPEHWDAKRLKYVATINDEALSEKEDPLRPIAYVDIGSVDASRGVTATEEMVFEDAPSRARRLVRHGDTIVSTVRTYLRAIAPIVEPAPETVVSTGFAVVRPRAVDAGYASWAMRESGFVEEIVARSTGVSYPAINATQIGDLPLPLPPLDEQRAIAAFLDRETEQLDGLRETTERAIERLQEYRSTLITAAVTGKIDVRVPADAMAPE